MYESELDVIIYEFLITNSCAGMESGGWRPVATFLKKNLIDLEKQEGRMPKSRDHF